MLGTTDQGQARAGRRRLRSVSCDSDTPDGPGVHIHCGKDEFFYVLQGEFRFKVGDRWVSGPVGTFIFLPRGQGHTFQNIGTEPGILLGGVMPGRLERLFPETSGAGADKLKKLAEKYTIEFIGPPLGR